MECDLLIVEAAIFELLSDRDRSKLEAQTRSRPSIVVTLEKSDFAALTYLQRGYLDCLVIDQLDKLGLQQSIQKALLRFVRVATSHQNSSEERGQVKDRRAKLRSGADRRRHARFYFERSIDAIPLLPNGAPDLADVAKQHPSI